MMITTSQYLLCTVDLARHPNDKNRQFWNMWDRRWSDDPKDATLIHDIGEAQRMAGMWDDHVRVGQTRYSPFDILPSAHVIRVCDLPDDEQRDLLSL